MITIHPARTEQVQQIKSLLSRSWVDTYGALLPESVIQTATTTWHAIDALRAQIEHEGVYFPIAQNTEGEIVGLATASLREDVLILGRLYVDPGQQRQGIGGRLLQSAIDAHPTARKIRLEVERDNTKGYNFYKKMGFVEAGEQAVTIADVVVPVVTMEMLIHTGE